MQKINKLALSIFASLGICGSALSAAECALCESIRADNAANHKNYEYYEDYLNAKKQNNAPKPVEASTAPSEKPAVAAPTTAKPAAK